MTLNSFLNLVHNKERHGMEIFSTLFTLFYFFPLYFYPGVNALFVLKVVLLYVVLYGTLMSCVFLKRQQKVYPAYVLVVLCSIGAGMFSGVNAFYGFAVFYLAMGQRFWPALFSLLFTTVCALLAAYKFDLLFAYFILPAAIPSFVLFFGGIFERKDSEHKKREQQSGQQLEQLATVAERERIARDLHDVLGHTLSSIALKSQLAEKLMTRGDTEAAKKEIKEVSELTSSTLQEVRQAISGYKLMTIDERVAQLCERLREKGLEVNLEVDFSCLKAKAESAVSLLLTEAVTNILRHSSATEVSIHTQIGTDKNFKLRICDNGQLKKLVMGNGLRGIEERVEELNGRFELNTDEGVCLNVYLGPENLK